jgi:DNA-binding HxlR family transcriptional regulator
MAECFGDEMCPRYERAVQILGKRWTAMIVRTLLARPRRFSDMTSIIDGLSDRLLSERLKELESCGILGRHVYPDTPVRIEYRLTDKGRELEQVVEAIQSWANSWDANTELATTSRGEPQTARLSSY